MSPLTGSASHPSIGADSIGCGPERAASADCDAARTAPSWANIEAARSGAEPELTDSATGGELSFSLGRMELARIRTASPSATMATTKP